LDPGPQLNVGGFARGLTLTSPMQSESASFSFSPTPGTANFNFLNELCFTAPRPSDYEAHFVSALPPQRFREVPSAEELPQK